MIASILNSGAYVCQLLLSGTRIGRSPSLSQMLVITIEGFVCTEDGAPLVYPLSASKDLVVKEFIDDVICKLAALAILPFDATKVAELCFTDTPSDPLDSRNVDFPGCCVAHVM